MFAELLNPFDLLSKKGLFFIGWEVDTRPWELTSFMIGKVSAQILGPLFRVSYAMRVLTALSSRAHQPKSVL